MWGGAEDGESGGFRFNFGGDADAAAEIDVALAALHRDLFVESNPIPVKWALERMGRIPGGIRLPLTRLSDEHQPVVEAALAQSGELILAVTVGEHREREEAQPVVTGAVERAQDPGLVGVARPTFEELLGLVATVRAEVLVQ